LIEDRVDVFSASPPWVVLQMSGSEDREQNQDTIFQREGVRVVTRRLRGGKMRSRQGLMDEFGAALQFFEGFGENWHALSECLSYVDEWLPADCYILVVTDSHLVLSDEKLEQLHWLLAVLGEVGAWWSTPIVDNDRFNRPAVPFHVLFKCPAAELDATRDRFDQASKSRPL
jgi:Barstar (barnase inhibitor)